MKKGDRVRLTENHLGAYHTSKEFGVGDEGTVEGPHPVIPGWFDVVMKDQDGSVVPVHESQIEAVRQ